MSRHTDATFDVGDVTLAEKRLSGSILRTPLLFSPALSALTDAQIYLKMECWQLCGCFKVRGAINMVSALSPEERTRGLVTCSSGNHGTALAYAATLFDRPPTKVFLPTYADPNKVSKLKLLGAEAILTGDTFLETLTTALHYADEQGATYVHSHGHPLVIAGQGTIGLEIMNDLPDVDTILAPIGGGGLASGISTVVKAAKPDTEIIGIEPTGAPGAWLSFRDGRCHEQIDLTPSVADGLVGTLTPLTWEILRERLDNTVLLDEPEILDGMRVLQEEEQLMVEGAAAVGLAAILSNKVSVAGKKTVLILTGRNISAEKYNALIATARGEAEAI